jgi:NADPH:quinone reductase
MPAPGPGEVCVRLVVSGVNPTDWKTRNGARRASSRASVQVPGHDGAGYVACVGDGVEGVEIGTRVWVWEAAWQRAEGTTQEYLVIPAANIVELPGTASFDEGASLGIPALTAHRALTAHERAPACLAPGTLEGMVVLVAGGAGAVGHAAIQLASWAGAKVITTVSTEKKAELARRAGAHAVINYRTEDVTAKVHQISPSGADIIVEVNARENMDVDLAVVAEGGTIAVFTSDDIDSLVFPGRECMTKNVRVQFVLTYTTTAEQKLHAVRAVQHALSEGRMGVGENHGLPLHRFPLEQAAQAHDASEQGVMGKVLIDITEDSRHSHKEKSHQSLG